MVISRKKNLLIFLIVIIIISISPISLAGVTFWDIHENEIFFRGSGNGPISLNNAGTAEQIQIVDDVVEFSSLSVGAGSISFIGFNSSVNANLTVISVGADMVVYNVDAPNGVNTTTIVKIPPNRIVRDVEGEDSYSFNATSDLVTIYEVHGLITKQIIIYLRRGSGAIGFMMLILICSPIIVLLVWRTRKR